MFANLPAAHLMGAVLSLTLSACSLSEPGPSFVDEPVTQAAQALVEPWVSGTAPGVAVAVALDGELVWARGAASSGM